MQQPKQPRNCRAKSHTRSSRPCPALIHAWHSSGHEKGIDGELHAVQGLALPAAPHPQRQLRPRVHRRSAVEFFSTARASFNDNLTFAPAHGTTISKGFPWKCTGEAESKSDQAAYCSILQSSKLKDLKQSEALGQPMLFGILVRELRGPSFILLHPILSCIT